MIILLLYGANMVLTMKRVIIHLQRFMSTPSSSYVWVSAQDIIRLCNIQRSDRTLDVSCGIGIVSRLAIDYVDATVGKVAGVDFNPIMLNMARRCSDGKDIEWEEGSATSLPFPNESFDLIIYQQGLQFFPDKLKALEEMNWLLVGVARSREHKNNGSGRLALSVCASIKESPGFLILKRLLEETIRHEAAAIMQLPHWLSDRTELVSLVKAAGFSKIISKKWQKQYHSIHLKNLLLDLQMVQCYLVISLTRRRLTIFHGINY